MTTEEIRLVRSSWSMIAERADAFTARFYDHLFVIDAGAAQLFNGVDMSIQQWKLAQTLGVVVQALDDLDALLPAVAALGRRHTRYGVLHHHFDSVGAALIQAFVDTLGQQFTPTVRAAWVHAYSLVATEMQKGLGSAPPPLRMT
jgi:hemoglobin-like flavoprotein